MEGFADDVQVARDVYFDQTGRYCKFSSHLEFLFLSILGAKVISDESFVQ